MDHSRPRGTGRLILGFILLGFGVLWSLDNLDIYESDKVLRYWPLILVAVGLVHLTSRRFLSGILLTAAGLLLSLHQAGIIEVNVWSLWLPATLVVVGTMIIIRTLRSSSSRIGEPGPEAPNDRGDQSLNTFAFMGGMTRRSASPDLKGGDVTAVMGGAELDLRGARSVNGQVVLDVFAWWGGIEITIPDDWTVVCEVTALLGGFEDRTRPPIGAATTRLVVRGMVVMGGVEVKN
jgi:predicted membrane protein